MPIISMFFGIKIYMYFNDLAPPHFHAEYNGQQALIDIQKATVLKSALPKRQLKLVLAWAELNRDQLMQNWELAKASKELMELPPLRK